MWSACIEIYLGRGLVMSKVRNIPVVVSHHSANASILEMLAAHEFTKFFGRSWFKRRVRFTLGAGLCGTNSLHLPENVKNKSEIAVIAHAVAEASEETSAIRCAMNLKAPSIVASLLDSDFKAMSDWCQLNNGYVASIVPLWSAASCLSEASEDDIKAVLVYEKNVITAVSCSNGSLPAIFCWNAQETPANHHMHTIRRWMLGAGLSEQEVLSVQFSEVLSSPEMSGGGYWARHWQKP